jgi:hypothetical protein
VRDVALSVKDPGALQLDLLGVEALEQTARLAEQDRDDVELKPVEDAAVSANLRGSGAVASGSRSSSRPDLHLRMILKVDPRSANVSVVNADGTDLHREMPVAAVTCTVPAPTSTKIQIGRINGTAALAGRRQCWGVGTAVLAGQVLG